jgi:GPH family glycoside/pentoside/hexuronide:cation symporter
METQKSVFKTSFKTRMLYSLTSLGVCIPAEAIWSGIVGFYVVDVMNLPITWFGLSWSLYTIYNALNNPVIGYLSDRTKSRWGRRIPYVKFTAIPYIITFILMFSMPFDGKTHPVELLVCFLVVMTFWETIYTAIATGYYGLLPEMFDNYAERTDVAAKMNIFQGVGLLLATALPPKLVEILGPVAADLTGSLPIHLPPMVAKTIGWPAMAIVIAAVSIVSIYVGKTSLFEVKGSSEKSYVPFWGAVRATFINKSFLAAATAQAMRFFGTGVLTAGMLFYLKYSLNIKEGDATIVLGIVFIVAIIALYPWRQIVANKTDSRTSLILSNLIMIIGVIPMGFARSMTFVYVCSAIIGIGLSGLILIGDVIIAEVVDEDEVKMGQQRAGMYFGMSSFVITISSGLVSGVLGIMMPYFGYDTALEVQPETVNLGFRLFMTIPSIIGFLLAILALYIYPLHGNKLKEIREALDAKEKAKSEATAS